jgi:hypothetical protein
MVSIFRRQLRRKSDPSSHRVVAARLPRLFGSSRGLRFPARAFLGLAAAKIFPQRSRQAVVAAAVFPCFAAFVSPVHNLNYVPGSRLCKAGIALRHRGPLWQFPPRSRRSQIFALFLLP